MKRRFIAIFLAGGLMLGVCGCGGSSGSSMASTPPAEVESDSAATIDEVTLEEHDAEKLVNMWASFAITEEEIEDKVATGEISHEVYEEFLDRMSNNQELNIIQADEASEDEDAASDIDVSSLLTAHVIEYEDRDGYSIRETCRLSPIFTEDDSDAMYTLWKTLGYDTDSFPSEDTLYDASHSIEYARDADSCDKLEYIIGIYTIENLTDGFPITSDNPRTYIGSIHAEQVFTDDEEHDANASNSFNLRSVFVTMYPDGASYYAEQDANILAKAKMSSDVWGPTCFIIVLPNGTTPNRPDGYRYDKIRIEFGNKSYGGLGYNVFELEYFE